MTSDRRERQYEWTPDSITWYVDGEAVYSTSAADGEELPEVPGHIMMNLWAGDTDIPGMAEWLGEYDGSSSAEAWYKEFSFIPMANE